MAIVRLSFQGLMYKTVTIPFTIDLMQRISYLSMLVRKKNRINPGSIIYPDSALFHWTKSQVAK